MLLEKIGELPYQAAAFGRCQATPCAMIESFTRGSYSEIDVGAISFGYLSQHFAGCRIVAGEHLSGRGVDPLSVD